MLDGNPPFDELDCPRKSFNSCHFSDQTIWLALALLTQFWRAIGTIVGTFRKALNDLSPVQRSTRFGTEGRLFESRFPRFQRSADASDM